MSTPDHHSIEVEVGLDDVDVVLDRIWRCGPAAVGEEDTATGVRFIAGFVDGASTRRALDQLTPWRPTLTSVVSDDWVSSWRRRAVPQVVGPFRIRLPHHRPAEGHIDLVIEPGASFGFGHASTRLALELIAHTTLDGRHVLDIGSGSGILGIATAKLGAVTVHAVDIDPVAVEATADNARRNGVRVRAHLGSVEATPDAPVDVMLANLTAGTQAVVLPILGARVGAHTTLILSGLLTGQEGAIAPLIAGHQIVEERHLDGWTAVRLEPSIASPRR